MLSSIWTFGAFAAAIIGLVWIRGTLTATQEAADASREAVAVTKDGTRKELRAYLAVKGVEITFLDKTHLSLRLDLTNLGSTPAKNIEIRRAEWVGPRNNLDPMASGPKPWLAVFYQRSLGRDQKDKIDIVGKKDVPPKINEPETDFYFYGKITYTDVFGDEHWVTFAYTPSGYTAQVAKMVPCVFGNNSS